jgi:hypothetical protein
MFFNVKNTDIRNRGGASTLLTFVVPNGAANYGGDTPNQFIEFNNGGSHRKRDIAHRMKKNLRGHGFSV